ncbi:MAG: tetratricopeptide repeat protein [Planctomycetota bacterium]|nr:tetratricopeptide repeat protein [Planctomycetota bacterium]
MKRLFVGGVVFISLLLFTIMFADEGGEKKFLLRWRFKKDERYEYSLYGTVSEERGKKQIESRVRGVVVVTGSSETEGVFLRRYEELRWREDGVSFCSPQDELEHFTLTFNFGVDGRVKSEISKEKLQDLLTSLMPLSADAVSVGDIWEVKLPSMGLSGSCEMLGWEEKDKRRCAVLVLRASRLPEGAREPDKELETKAHFDSQEGCFVAVERRIKERGDDMVREEVLTLTLKSSPVHPSKERLFDSVVGELRSRVSLSPKDTASRKKLIGMLMETGRYEEALKEVESAIAFEPSAEFYVLGGDSAFALGDGERALKFYEEALKRDAKSKPALLGAAKATFSLGRYEESIGYAKRSFEGGKGPYQALYYVGASLAKLGRREEAEDILRRYIEKSPDFDPNKKHIIAFTKEGDVRILVEPKVSTDISKKSRYSDEELELGRQVLAVVVKEESLRMKLSPEEVEKMLEYMASVYGKEVEKMLSDFLADREQTSQRLKTLLDEKSRIPQERLEALNLSEFDADFCVAALSLIQKEDLLKRFEALKEERKGVLSIHNALLRLYLSNPARFKNEIISSLQLLKDIEPENGFYPLIEGWLWFVLKNQKAALKCIGESALCNHFSTHFLEEARKRREVLLKVGYSGNLLDVTAWTTGERRFEKWVKEVLDATLFLAKKFFEDGDFKKAKELSLLVHRICTVIEHKTDSALLYCSAVGLEEIALSLLLEVAKKQKDEKTAHLEELLSSAKKNSSEMLERYKEFLSNCEMAISVWWITEPKKCSTFFEKLFNIGEKEVLKELGGK